MVRILSLGVWQRSYSTKGGEAGWLCESKILSRRTKNFNGIAHKIYGPFATKELAQVKEAEIIIENSKDAETTYSEQERAELRMKINLLSVQHNRFNQKEYLTEDEKDEQERLSFIIRKLKKIEKSKKIEQD